MRSVLYSFLTAFPLFCSVLCAAEPKIGEEFYGDYLSPAIKAGTTFRWVAYIPSCYDPSKPAALYVGHDGLNMVHAQTLEKLALKGDVPVTICVGLAAGTLLPTSDGGSPRNMRAEEYDDISSEYPDFLVDEFIPWFANEYHLNIDPNPDMHMVAGSSSGGLSAWNIAWHRNDYFHRCYLASPSFMAIRLGEETLYNVRLSEPRPIRIYETYGEKEPNMYDGNSYLAALFAENTLEYAGYPVKSKFIPGGEHGAGYNDPETTEEMLRYLWEHWQTEPVKPFGQQERLDRIVQFGTAWEETTEPFPSPISAETSIGTYSYQKNAIFFTDLAGHKTIVSEEFDDISGITVSTDGWRLYISDRSQRFVFALAIYPDGTLGKPYIQAPLRLPYEISQLGANAICLDTKDRLYAATPMGVQSIISFGIVDAILPLPGDLPAEDIAFGGKDNNILYVRSGKKVFKRPMKTTGKTADFPITSPGTAGYYDGD